MLLSSFVFLCFDLLVCFDFAHNDGKLLLCNTAGATAGEAAGEGAGEGAGEAPTTTTTEAWKRLCNQGQASAEPAYQAIRQKLLGL